MKTRLLSGLTALLLGGLTSCSNILEENGVINNVAESGMGELRINLTTDPTVEAITKAGSEDPSNFFVQIDQQSYNYNTWKNGLTVAEGDNKTVEAYNKLAGDVKNFEWNAPYYKGEEKNVSITAGNTTEVSIECKRANSTLVVDTTGFDSEDGQKILCVKSLMAYKDNTTSNAFDLLKKEGQAPSNTDSVCVKAGINAIIVLTPAKMDGTPLSTVTTYINDDRSQTGKTAEGKRYKVSYTVKDNNGQATITIKVNDSVQEVELPAVEINPYNSTTQENQSTNGSGE